jgi:VWFA-related protein
MKMKIEGLLLAGATLFGSLALSQQAGTPAAIDAPRAPAEASGFVQTAVVDLVSFEVSVTDAHGPVLGLTASDFRVLHDGKQVELSNFSCYGRAGESRAPAMTGEPSKPDVASAEAPVVAERPGLSLNFYVDNANLSTATRGPVLDAAIDFVRTRVGPGDRVAVTTHVGGPKIVQGLTGDRELAVSALRRLRDEPGGWSITNVERLRVTANLRITAAILRQVIVTGRPSAVAQAAAIAQGALDEVRTFEQTERVATRDATRGLRAILTAMSAMPGRKVLVYVSDGLAGTPGQAVYRAFEDYFREFPAARSQVNDARMAMTGEGSEQKVFDDVVVSAAAAGVTLFTIDARGLVAPGDAESAGGPSATWSRDVRNYQEPLQKIAAETGGSAFVNGGDFKAGLERFSRELDSYYLVGYPLPRGGRSAVHTVGVELVNRKGCRLDYRRRFVEQSLPALIEDRVLAALSFDAAENLLGIAASAGAWKKGASKTRELPVRISVPIGKLALLPEGDEMVGKATAYYVTRGPDGKQSALLKAEHRVAVPKGEYESARGKTWPITATLVVKPGSYRISVAVRDALTGTAGYATLDVPEDSPSGGNGARVR